MISPVLREAVGLLRRDPSGLYEHCHAHTQAAYAASLSVLARRAHLSTDRVARIVLDRAESAHQRDAASPEAHVGYHLLGQGQLALEQTLRSRYSPWERFRLGIRTRVETFYRTLVPVWATAVLAIFVVLARVAGLRWPATIAFAFVAIPIALEYACRLSRAIVSDLVNDRTLPKMAFRDGIPPQYETVVAISALISSGRRARELVERMEALSRVNLDANLRFVLLSDFTDCATETDPHDSEIRDALRAAVACANARGRDTGLSVDRFFAVHRERRWSATQMSWIGWERKRGKVLHLLDLLHRGEQSKAFADIIGDETVFAKGHRFPFLLTLDEATWLPPGSVDELLRIATHPLNRARIDDASTRVLSGYAIFQPTLVSTLNRTEDQTGQPGDGSTSPLGGLSHGHGPGRFHFEVLGAGRYQGKALLDAAACHALLTDAFPPECVLQHDMLEGLAARTANVRSASLVEELPRSYLDQLLRGHRWIRGEVQALPWTLPFTRDGRARSRANPIDVSGRLYIAGLVCRQLVRPATLALLVGAWSSFVRHSSLLTWVALPAVVFLTVSFAAGALVGIAQRATDLLASRHPRRPVPRLPWSNLILMVFAQAMLAFEALLVLDAFVRTAWRVSVSRRNLLDWSPRPDSAAGKILAGSQYPRLLWPSIAVAAGTALLVWNLARQNVVVAAPFVLLWMLTPWLVMIVDRAVINPSVQRSPYPSGTVMSNAPERIQ